MKNNRIMNIAIWGSCITKDPFTTAFNENYKEYFNALINDQRHSFISIMQEKKTVSEEDILILPQEGNNRFETKCIKEDFEKKFIDDIQKYDIDYLIFDVNFEIEYGILSYGDNEYITNFIRFPDTQLYNKMPNKRAITVFNNPVEFFDLWKEYCDKFFKFMEEKSPKTKIILAEVRALDMVQKEDGSYYIEEKFTEKAKNNNNYYKQLEDYIKNNFDVYVVTFDKDIVLKENHRWGKYYVHYCDEYYGNFLNKVLHIVDYDQLKNNESRLLNNENKLNNKIRELEQELKKLSQENNEIKQNNIELESELKEKNSSIFSKATWHKLFK